MKAVVSKYRRNYRRMLLINRCVFGWCVGIALLNACQHNFVSAAVALGSLCAMATVLADLMPRWMRTIQTGERIEAELAREIENLNAVYGEWLVR